MCQMGCEMTSSLGFFNIFSHGGFSGPQISSQITQATSKTWTTQYQPLSTHKIVTIFSSYILEQNFRKKIRMSCNWGEFSRYLIRFVKFQVYIYIHPKSEFWTLACRVRDGLYFLFNNYLIMEIMSTKHQSRNTSKYLVYGEFKGNDICYLN